MNTFEEDCEEQITVRSDGAIVYQSLLQNMYPDVPFGSSQCSLMSIIEDNIVEDPDGVCFIDWPQVWKQYEEAGNVK